MIFSNLLLSSSKNHTHSKGTHLDLCNTPECSIFFKLSEEAESLLPHTNTCTLTSLKCLLPPARFYCHPHFPTLPTMQPSLCECSVGMAGMVECRQRWAPGSCGRCYSGKINMPDRQHETSAFPQAQKHCRCQVPRIRERFWQERWACTYMWKQSRS